MVKYAFALVLFVLIVGGAYCTGYRVGSANRQIEYVTKQVEVVKYVEKEKAKIYAQPNAGRDDLLKLMRNGKL